MTKAESKIQIIRQVMRITQSRTYTVSDSEACMMDPVERKSFLDYWKNHGFKVKRRKRGYVLC